MSNERLDAIKARAELVAGKPDNREPTEKEWAALTDGAIHDVPALLAAVEAVLAIHEEVGDAAILNCDCGCGDEPRSWESITEPGDTITMLELTEKGDKKDGGV